MKMSYASYHDLIASFIAESCEPEVISLKFFVAIGKDMCESYLTILKDGLGLKCSDYIRNNMKRPERLAKMNYLVNEYVDFILKKKPELRYKEVEI